MSFELSPEDSRRLAGDDAGRAAAAARPRIVWADDNADMRYYVSKLLGPAFDVEAVPDGTSALAAIRRAQPDLVLADVMMPGMDGVELLRTVRADAATAAIPFVLLSGRSGEASRVEGLEAGADDYLIKPFGPRELLARVETHVKLARLRRELAADRRRTEATLRDHAAWLRGQGEALMAAVDGAPLSVSLGALVRTASETLGEDVRVAFYLANDEGTVLHHVVGGMPPEHAHAVGGVAMGLESLACGPSCWSFPIHSAAGILVGTLALHRRQPREVTAPELELGSLLTNTASIIISRHRESEVRRRAEEALRESEEQLRRLNERLEERVRERTAQINALFKRVISAQEEERRRIARDIHDQLGQQMTALRMALETLQAGSDGSASFAAQLARTQWLAGELDESIDFLTWQLRPAALDHLGLSAALRHLVSGWSERFGVAADFDVAGDDSVRLAPEVEANVYGIMQEALHNVAKHAQATHVSVFMDLGDDETVVVIEDDGCGFDDPLPPDGHGHGLGLVSMRERATFAGGSLSIESRRGGGTAVFVWIPTPPPQSA